MSTSARQHSKPCSLAFRRAPWLIEGKKPLDVIAENIRMTSEAIRTRLGIAPAGFRSPGGFPNGIADDASMYQKTKVCGLSTEYSDIGYPLACELEDGRIFTSYYFMLEDGTVFGGARFIAGSYFRLS